MEGVNEYDAILAKEPAPPPIVPPPASATAEDKAQRNEYDDLLDNYQGAVSQAAHGTVTVNSGVNPDHAARAQALSPQLGIPASVIESDLPTFEARAKAIHDNATIAANPMLASWVAQNREGARAAQDDFDKLGTIEKAFTALKTGSTGAIQQNELGRLYNVKQVSDQLGISAPETDQQIAALEGQMGKMPDIKGGWGLLQSQAGFWTGYLDNFLSSAPEAVGGAGLGFAAAGPPGAAAGAVAGAFTGFKVDMARVSAGLNYRATQYVRDQTGAPLTTDARNVGALMTGILTYAIAGVGTQAAGKVTDEAVSQFTSEAVTQALTRPTVTKALKTFAKTGTKAVATGATMMAGMEATNIIGEEMAKELSPGDFATVFNDPATRMFAVERLANAAEAGAILFGTLHVVSGGVGLAGDFMRATQASHDRDMLQAVQQGSEGSALRGRSRQAFADFMHHQTDGSPVENLYLPVEKVLQLYQGAKIDPGEIDRAQDPIFGWVADMPQQIAQAKEHGGDVVIPTADYITHLAGTDIGNGLLDDVRVRPDAMSVNEAKAYMDNLRESVRSQLKESLAAQEGAGATERPPHERVYQDVLEQAKAAGFGSTQARQYAALYSARYSARASRLGIDPWEAYQRSGIQIRTGEAPRETGPGGVPIETGKQVPYAAGTNKAGTEVYIDRAIPRYLEIDGKKVDVHQFIAMHEEYEKRVMDTGVRYWTAHKEATNVEKVAVEKAGIDWKAYSRALAPYISRAEHEKYQDVPHDLETKPYTDEGEASKVKGALPKQEPPMVAGSEPIGFLRLLSGSGINREEARAQGIDPAFFKEARYRDLFPKQGGMTFDEAAEHVSQYGYGSEKYSANEFLEMLDSALSGEEPMSRSQELSSLDAQMEAEMEMRYGQDVDYKIMQQAEKTPRIEGVGLEIAATEVGDPVIYKTEEGTQRGVIVEKTPSDNLLSPFTYKLKLDNGADVPKARQRQIDPIPELIAARQELEKKYFQGEAPGKPRLSVLHNLSSENLEFADKMGGLAVPSLAVVKEGMGLEGYGDVTLIGRADLANPKTTDIYDADAYSSTFPRPEYKKVKSAVAQKLVDAFRPWGKKFEDRNVGDSLWNNAVNRPDPEQSIQTLLNSNAAKAMFLKDVRGIDIEPSKQKQAQVFPWVGGKEFKEKFWDLYKQVDEAAPEERGNHAALYELGRIARDAIDRYMEKHPKETAALREVYGEDAVLEHYGTMWGVESAWVTDKEKPMPWMVMEKISRDIQKVGKQEVNIGATRRKLDKALIGKESEFKQWVEDNILPMYGEPFLTVGGKRGAYNLDNIVEKMTRNGMLAQEDTMVFGEGKARAVAAHQIGDLNEMRNRAEWQITDRGEVDKIREEAKKAMSDWRDAVLPYYGEKNYRGEIDTWNALDASMRAIASWARGKELGAALRKEGFKDMPPEVIEHGKEAGNIFMQAPVPYFEAKPQRAVKLSEFAGAVIPEDASANVKAILDKNKIPYQTYPKRFDEAARTAVLNKFRNELADQGADVLFQKERGAITLGQGKAIIDLFKNRDLSTLLHETSHLWLEELKRDAALSDAPQQLKDDLAAALKWMKVESPEQIGREQHEQFARAGEAYFMEGKAPSTELAGVFQRFKAWLTHIYKTVTGLQTPINDEIRSVFDRLIATDAEIEHAQQATGILADEAQQKFRDSLSGLMTKAEFSAYMKAIERAGTEANQTLLAKMMEKVRRERKADWKAERDRVTEEVTPQIDERPDIQALTYMPKLDRAIIEKIYQGNPAMMYFLPKTLLAKEGGVHPDQAAEMFGFPSGDAMIKALVNLEQEKRRMDVETGKTKGIRQHLIDQAVDAKMTETYGDLMNDASVQDEAMAAVHNRAQEEALATELKVMGREQGHPPIPLELARDWATTTIGGKNVGEVSNPNRYARAEAKSAKAAEMALLADKPQEAYLHKRQQILNHLLFTAAQDAGKNIERAEKLLDRLAGEASFKNIDQEYTDRIHSLLGRFGYRIPRSPDELARGLEGETLEGFAQRKFDDGYELAIDPMFFNPDLKGDTKHLTVDQFLALHDAVKSMQVVGRDENTIQIGGERTDREVAVAQMVSHLQALPQRKPSEWYRPEDAGKLKALKERTLAFLRSADASALKEEQLFDWMDSNDPNGPFNKYIFRPLKEAQLRADDMRRQVARQLQSLMASMPKEWAKGLEESVPNDTLTDPKTGVPIKFIRKRMLSMALNVGAADNAAKLAAGYRWTEPAIMDFLHQNMTEPDWRFVQKMWDTMGQFRTEIDSLQRRVTGVGIEYVQPRAVSTKFGEIPGGYFPIVYDPIRSPEAERHLAKAAAEMFENQYYRATTPKGYTIKRVQGVQRPITLDLDIIPWKIGQVIHDLNFREAIMDAGKLLSDKRVLTGIDDTFGHEYTKTMRPWLQSIANSRNINDNAVDWIDKSLRWARTNTTMVGIGFRLSTMYKHGMTALSNSVGELGPTWMMRGVQEAFGTPEQMKRTYQFVLDSSGEMRNRIDRYDRDIRENLKTLLNENGLKADAQRYATYGVGYLDMMSAVPTWLGGYRKALSEGMTDKDAVYYADKTVRKAHGSQGLVDLAQLQRGNEFQKLLTMFYGFFNHIYNRQRDILRQGRLAAGKMGEGDYAGARRDFAKVLARSMTYLVVPALVEALYTSGGPNDKKDEGWGEWAGKAILAEIPAGIPIVRDIAKSAIEGRDYEFSPIVRGVMTAVGTGKDIGSLLGARDQNASKKWLRHAIETAGYATGWPTGQAGTSAQFLWDTAQGDQQPQDLYDWYHGLSFGKVKEQ